MTGYDAILFDNDGVLVEPPTLQTKRTAMYSAFQAAGITSPRITDVDTLAHEPSPATLEQLCARYELDAESFWPLREHHDERAQRERFRTGERTMYPDVEVLDDLPQPLGLVSNNQHSVIVHVLETFELDHLFETFIGRPDTIESLTNAKPEPTFLQRALSALDVSDALYVGDRATDVIAAQRAGIEAAFLRRPHNADTELEVKPTTELDSLWNLRSAVE